LAIALAAREAVCVGAGARIDPSQVFDRILAHVNEPELCRALELAAACLGRGAAPGELLTALGSRRGVSGYVVHTVPVAIFLWLRHAADFRAGVESAVRLGGDTDTVAALVGALAGASQGPSGIPSDWLRGLCEWPRTIAWLERLAARLARRFGEPLSAEPSLGPEPLYWPALVPRSALFAGIVLAHGFRRLLPPY
jgi:ADP-ribosylglycohydrolase